MKLLGRGLLESKHEFRLLFLTIGRNHSVSCYPRTYLVGWNSEAERFRLTRASWGPKVTAIYSSAASTISCLSITQPPLGAPNCLAKGFCTLQSLGWGGMCQAFRDNSDEELVSNGCVQLGCSTTFPAVARCLSSAGRKCTTDVWTAQLTFIGVEFDGLLVQGGLSSSLIWRVLEQESQVGQPPGVNYALSRFSHMGCPWRDNHNPLFLFRHRLCPNLRNGADCRSTIRGASQLG